MDENWPTIQRLMDSAYEKHKEFTHFLMKWNPENQTRPKRADWLRFLPKLERYAVVLGNWNYQVCNGGIIQWADNGYCIGWEYLRELMGQIGSEYALRVEEMVKDAAYAIDFNPLHKWRDFELKASRYEPDNWYFADRANEYDLEYYTFNDLLMDECEAWFVGQMEGK